MKKFVVEAVVAKKVVVVAEVPVAFVKVTFWSVLDPVARMLLAVSVPLKVRLLPPPVVKARVFAKKVVLVAWVVVEFPVTMTSPGNV